MEQPGIASVLAVGAGLLNAWAFANAQTFATVQSGNVIQMGYQLVAGDWSKLLFATGAVIAFGLGSFFAGAIIAVAMRKSVRYTPFLQVALIAVMFLALTMVMTGALRPEHIAWIISFAAGMQGNGFHKVKGMSYGNVAVTLALQLAFNYLMQSFFSKKDANGASNLRNAGIYFLVILGFAGGGAIGFGLDKLWNGLSIVGAIAITFGLLIAAIRDRSNPDATA
ncbi:YoaK family protein [Actinomycetaceae bacterium MB13-C1-2]|nr:YoaK family protein [Actinomycetaceae bacterium MB13-C1-2]